MKGENNLFKYYYNVNYNGYPVTRYRLVTRQEFISITDIDPVNLNN